MLNYITCWIQYPRPFPTPPRFAEREVYQWNPREPGTSSDNPVAKIGICGREGGGHDVCAISTILSAAAFIIQLLYGVYVTNFAGEQKRTVGPRRHSAPGAEVLKHCAMHWSTIRIRGDACTAKASDISMLHAEASCVSRNVEMKLSSNRNRSSPGKQLQWSGIYSLQQAS
jgi:hypothetical protein